MTSIDLYFDTIKTTKNYNRALSRTNINCDLLSYRLGEINGTERVVNDEIIKCFRAIIWNHIIQAYYKDYGIDIIPETCGDMYGYLVRIVQKNSEDVQSIGDFTSGSLRFDLKDGSFETLEKLASGKDYFVTLLEAMKYIENNSFAQNIFTGYNSLENNDEIYVSVYQLLTTALCLDVVSYWILGEEGLPEYLSRNTNIQELNYLQYFSLTLNNGHKCYIHRNTGDLHLKEDVVIKYHLWCNGNIGHGLKFLDKLADEKEYLLMLRAGVGGFTGKSFNVEINFMEGICEYTTFKPHFIEEAKEIIRINPKYLSVIAKELIVKTSLWKETYKSDEIIMDGTNWNVELVTNKKVFMSSGSNAYPSNWRAFCKAVGKYIGREFC